MRITLKTQLREPEIGRSEDQARCLVPRQVPLAKGIPADQDHMRATFMRLCAKPATGIATVGQLICLHLCEYGQPQYVAALCRGARGAQQPREGSGMLTMTTTRTWWMMREP